MKKMMKRIAAIALMACMVLTMVPYASAASENTLTVKVTDRVLNKIVTMKNDTGLGDTAKLIESIFDIIGAETMGDGLSNAYKTAHRNHIAQGKSSSDPVCTPEKCGLYSIWTVELDDWFDDAKAAYLGGTWSSWISSDVDDGLFSGSSNGDLKEYLEDSTTPISKLTLKKEYTMTSANSRYVFSVTRTKPTGGGGGSVSNTTTETVKNEDGSVTTGWAEINGQKRYFSVTGALRTGWLETEEGRRYLLSNGTMATGWKRVDGEEYFFDENGVLRTSGWITMEDGLHYLYEDGSTATGWVDLPEGRFCFDENGCLLAQLVENQDKTRLIKAELITDSVTAGNSSSDTVIRNNNE